MIRLKLTLCYDGTAYHGWQIQQNAQTVQGVIQQALQKLYETPVSTVGCSRTDAGVHAEKFVCHCDVPFSIPEDKIPLALNALLPDDVSVLAGEEVSEDFHARFSCKGKTYCYRLWNSRIRHALEWNRTGFFPFPVSAERMASLATAFVGEKDFAALMASGSEVTDTVRTIYDFRVQRVGERIDFTVTGNGFLYNMVRIMVGTLLYADLGKLDRSIEQILQSRDRTLAGITVPACGLYLVEPHY